MNDYVRNKKEDLQYLPSNAYIEAITINFEPCHRR